MTPNQPLIANKALWLSSLPAGYVPQSEAFKLIAELANVITYNAGQMNKLLDRVAELEAQLKPVEPAPETHLIPVGFISQAHLDTLLAANSGYYVTY